MKQITQIMSLILAIGLFSQTLKANTATQDILIQKLTQVYLSLPESNETKIKMTLRLADLHAERGRIKAKSLEACATCDSGVSDRKKAIEYYRAALPQIHGEQIQNVWIQIGHLHEVLSENNKAMEAYKKVIALENSPMRAEAQFSLAEIHFKNRDFVTAQKLYLDTMTSSTFKRKGLATFRSAWCFYNRGEINKAIQSLDQLLASPELLSRGGDSSASADQGFQSEVAKDFTVFVAHSSNVNSDWIQKVYQYSPTPTRIENVSFLAKELERLGRIEQAQKAWQMVVNETSDPQIRMEGLVYLAGLQLKINQAPQALPLLKKAFSHWSSLASCREARVCDELKVRLRTIVFDWNRVEQKNPSLELLEAYQGYFTVVSDQPQAFELASQVASHNKEFALALEWNLKAHSLTTSKEDQERLLLKRVEIAEVSKNPELLDQAQTFYLSKSSLKKHSSDIRYQRAQKSYEAKDFQKASTEFKALALHPATPGKLKAQAAELALDSLVLLKNDHLIETWAKEFAVVLPEKSQRMRQLASQSVLSQTAALSEKETDADAAWATLSRFDVTSADAERLKSYHQNRIILARKLKKFSEMEQSLRSYLGLKNLTEKEHTFALENKVWLSELQLNFDEAYQSYKKLNTKNWLETARLADLAEKNSRDYYIKSLTTIKDESLGLTICEKLVRDQKSMGSDLKMCLPHFNKDKNRFAALLLDIYGNQKKPKDLLSLLSQYQVAETPSAGALRRLLIFQEGESKVALLQKHKLDGRTSQIARSLKTRIDLITDFERTISKATEMQDWLTQTVFLSQLKSQYMGFFNELLGLPTPQELSVEEQQEYLTLLSQQAAPYKEKADQIQFKLDELWKNQAAIDQVYADFHKSSRTTQSLLAPPLEKLSQIEKPKGHDFGLVYRGDESRKVPSLGLLEMARQEVKSSPLNQKALKKLIQLETERGYKPMIIYLNSRLKLLEQGFDKQEKSL